MNETFFLQFSLHFQKRPARLVDCSINFFSLLFCVLHLYSLNILFWTSSKLIKLSSSFNSCFSILVQLSVHLDYLVLRTESFTININLKCGYVLLIFYISPLQVIYTLFQVIERSPRRTTLVIS